MKSLRVASLFRHSAGRRPALREKQSSVAQGSRNHTVEELCGDAAFRRHVRWTLDHLCRGASAAERCLVDDVDKALVDCAGRLSAIMNPCDANCSADAGKQDFLRKLAPFDCAVVRLVATQPWFDLTCGHDFLHPWQDLFLANPDQSHTQAFRNRGELRVPLGDYIVRMMLARVDYWKALLDRIFNDMFFGTYGSSPSLEQAREGLFSAKVDLDLACQRLIQACTSNELRLRESCLTLIQVYAAYAPQAKLDWLELPPSFVEANRGAIRSCIRRRGDIALAENRNGRLFVVGHEHPLLCDPSVLR
jgi:hypothetical protein